jgi:hypothetical protein
VKAFSFFCVTSSSSSSTSHTQRNLCLQYKYKFKFQVRAIDNYLGPWIVICINALIACLLSEVAEIRMPEENLQHWDTVSFTSLYSFLLVVFFCVEKKSKVLFLFSLSYKSHLSLSFCSNTHTNKLCTTTTTTILGLFISIKN